MIISGSSVELGSDEGVFVIRGEEAGIRAPAWDGNTLVEVSAEGLASGDVWILTGDQWGPFEVTTRLLDAPAEIGEEWEDVVEFSLTSTGPLVIAELVNHDPSTPLLFEPGEYRIRVSARDRGTRDGDADVQDETGEHVALEHYLVEAWPAREEPNCVVRLTSRHAVTEMTGATAEPAIEGASAGLAGARAIGRDVDAAAGARQLSGLTGTVNASRVLRGKRRKLMLFFAHVLCWSPGTPTWTFVSYTTADYQLGTPTYGYAHDHEDQLSGRTGAIRASIIEIDRPRSVVRRWNWMAPAHPGSRAPLAELVPFLPQDTIVTTTLSQTRDSDGQVWTEVSVEHAGLPVEWLDDMHAWWLFQFAIADHRQFGTRLGATLGAGKPTAVGHLTPRVRPPKPAGG